MAQQTTPLYDYHCGAHAHLIDFSGWLMPLHYGSQISEHHQVREQAGIFDVSHMGVVDIIGQDTMAFLRYVLANDINKLTQDGTALYSCLLNDQGGVIDDLIVYRLSTTACRLIINAANRSTDLAWLKKHSHTFKVSISLRTDHCILALQGPKALSILKRCIPQTKAAEVQALKPFSMISYGDGLIARTGYTGEDGVEIVLPSDAAIELWQEIITQGAKPCGLGARNTLRLEAGLNLYGHDMTEQTTPLVSNLAWTVNWQDQQRDFIGKQALVKQRQTGVTQELRGVIMNTPGVLRDHQQIFIDDTVVGEITSGGYSPTLGCGIGLARVLKNCDDSAFIKRRQQLIKIHFIKPPFVRHGKKVFKELEHDRHPE